MGQALSFPGQNELQKGAKWPERRTGKTHHLFAFLSFTGLSHSDDVLNSVSKTEESEDRPNVSEYHGNIRFAQQMTIAGKKHEIEKYKNLEQEIAQNRVTNWDKQYAKIALIEALLQCVKTKIPGSLLVLNLLAQCSKHVLHVPKQKIAQPRPA